MARFLPTWFWVTATGFLTWCSIDTDRVCPRNIKKNATGHCRKRGVGATRTIVNPPAIAIVKPLKERATRYGHMNHLAQPFAPRYEDLPNNALVVADPQNAHHHLLSIGCERQEKGYRGPRRAFGGSLEAALLFIAKLCQSPIEGREKVPAAGVDMRLLLLRGD